MYCLKNKQAAAKKSINSTASSINIQITFVSHENQNKYAIWLMKNIF